MTCTPPRNPDISISLLCHHQRSNHLLQPNPPLVLHVLTKPEQHLKCQRDYVPVPKNPSLSSLCTLIQASPHCLGHPNFFGCLKEPSVRYSSVVRLFAFSNTKCLPTRRPLQRWCPRWCTYQFPPPRENRTSLPQRPSQNLCKFHPLIAHSMLFFPFKL